MCYLTTSINITLAKICVARARIHVERAFARIQQYGRLQREIKLSSKDIAGRTFRVSYLTNYMPSILASEVKCQYFSHSHMCPR